MSTGGEDRARPLAIGIDARAATEVQAGRGRVVRELLLALAERDDPHRYFCYAREPWTEPLDSRFQWVTLRSPDPVWHARTAAAANRQCDVFLSTNSYLTVLWLRVPSAAIVYDLVTFEPGMRPNRRSLIIERLTLGPAVNRANSLICISQATADALVSHFPAAAGKIEVVPLGASRAVLAPPPADAEHLPAPGFVLAVGTLEPRKNLPRLIEAYAALPEQVQSEHPLVVVGARGWSTGPTLAAMRSLGDRCIALGHVSDEALAELYRRCSVFCYPSLGEGFGLPVLEAMAAGAPVVTSNLSSLPEVGGDAVEYADPRSVPSIEAALERVLDSPERRLQLSELGLRRARLFSWADAAARILAALEAVVRPSERSS